MKKIFEGTVTSVKMQKTVVIEIVRKSPHPLYGKLLRRSKKVKADTGDLQLNVGDKVKILETRPISKEKHFRVIEVIK